MRLFGNDCLAPQFNDGKIDSIPQNFCWKPVKEIQNGPIQRFQHAVCISGNCLFIYGGRGMHGTLNDLWKYNIDDETWCIVEADGDKPPPLEGHSIVEYNRKLYMFGGETSFASGGEVPLWIFNQKLCTWKKLKGSTNVPTGRREHTAVVYQDRMCVYGGYIDLKGPTNEMWMYHFEENEWELVESALSHHCPVARYKHAAVVYGDMLWVCGGLMGITNRNETQVWTWDFFTHKWCQIRTRHAPLQLFNHDICMVDNLVFIFGGNQEDGKSCSKLWKVSLSKLGNTKLQSWHRCCQKDKVVPSSSSNHCIVALPCKQQSFIKDCADTFEVLKSRGVREQLCVEDCNMANETKPLNWYDKSSPVTAHHLIKVKPYNDCVSLPKDEMNVMPPVNNVHRVDKSNETSHLCNFSQINYHAIDINDQCPLISSSKTGKGTSKMKKGQFVNKSFDLFDDSELENNSAENLCVFENGDSDFLIPNKHGKLSRISNIYQKVFEDKNDFDGAYENPSYPISPGLYQNKKVKQFSYNLSSTGEKTWKPMLKNNRFQTTSFVEVQPYTIQKVSDPFCDTDKPLDSAKDFVKYSKLGNHEKVSLPDSFFENNRILNKFEEKVDMKSTYKQKNIPNEICLLLLGGKQANSNVFIKQRISTWKCTFSL